MSRWFLVLITATVLALTPTLTAAEDNPPVSVRFIGEPHLSELASGSVGNGVLLYYSPEANAEEPRLLVRLTKTRSEGVAVAEIFDAPPGLSYVPILLDGTTVTVEHEFRPVITIRALDGWWVRDGKVNYNLDVQINGPVYAMWGGGYDSKFGPSGWTAQVKPGDRAVNIMVRDPDGEGIPKWDLRMLLPAFPDRGYYRTNYAERKCQTPLRHEPGVSPLWPYVAQSAVYEQPVGRLRPPIGVDWTNGRITHFSELVTVRNQNCSYSFYSINRLVPGDLNQPNFETPFAFYDLSGEGQGYPNLILRTERTPAQDPWSEGIVESQPKLVSPVDLETVRYSWRLEPGDWLWDYKVEVLGFHPYTFDTPIADGYAGIDAPPYEEFPRWVIDREWPVVTFIDTEGSSYRSSEGIYDWSPDEVGLGYALGWENTNRESAFADIRAGFRGEYRFRHSLPPRLYLSPIDKRLHLLGAEGGLWKLADSVVLRLHNLDGDPHIDGWTRERTDERGAVKPEESADYSGSGPFEEALYALNGHLIYSGPDGVELRQTDYHPSVFEIDPPTDKSTWTSFRQRLAPYAGQRPDPNDLRHWLTLFPGKSLAISNARISQVRATPSSFRFVLGIEPGFQIQGDDLLPIRDLVPGVYAVTYDEQRFVVERLTPPALSASVTGEALTALQPGAVEVTLRNDGLADLPDAKLELWAERAGRPATLVATRSVALLGKEPVTVPFPWVPPSAGDWTLTPRITQIDGLTTSLESFQVTIRPVVVVDSESVVAASTTAPVYAVAFVGLVTAAALTALAVGRQGQTTTGRPVDEPR